MNASGPYRWQVDIGLGNGLVASDTKPLSEPMLAKFCVVQYVISRLRGLILHEYAI